MITANWLSIAEVLSTTEGAKFRLLILKSVSRYYLVTYHYYVFDLFSYNHNYRRARQESEHRFAVGCQQPQSGDGHGLPSHGKLNFIIISPMHDSYYFPSFSLYFVAKMEAASRRDWTGFLRCFFTGGAAAAAADEASDGAKDGEEMKPLLVRA